MKNTSEGSFDRKIRPLLLAISGLLLAVALTVLYYVLSGGGVVSFFRIRVSEGHLLGPIIDMLNQGSETAILALGMSLVAACSGGVDLSVGAQMSLSGCLCCVLLAGYGVTHVRSADQLMMPVFLAAAVGILATALCGAFNGLMVWKTKLHPTVATLLLYAAGRSIGLLLTNSKVVYILQGDFRQIGQGYAGPLPMPLLITAGCFLLMAAVVYATPLGRAVRRAGENPQGARRTGVILVCFVLCGLMAGVAGLVATSRIYSADANNIGLNLELDAILAVLLCGSGLCGGKFSLLGSVIGAYTVRTLTTLLYLLGMAGAAATLVKAALILLILAIQSPALRAVFTGRRAQGNGVPAEAERS